MFGGLLKYAQDFIAPVFLFLKTEYQLTIKEAGDILSSGDVEAEVTITKKIFQKTMKEYRYWITIGQDGTFRLTIEFDKAKIKIECQNDIS